MPYKYVAAEELLDLLYVLRAKEWVGSQSWSAIAAGKGVPVNVLAILASQQLIELATPEQMPDSDMSITPRGVAIVEGTVRYDF